MKKWLKRIRGAVGMGLTWATGWGFVGGLLGVLLVAVGGGPVIALDFLLNSALAGFILGGSFSVVLAMEGRDRAFHEISLLRFTIWGAVGGLLVSAPLVLGTVGVGGWLAGPKLLVAASALAGLGAASAAGTLALARRADPLLESGEGVGLLEGELPDPS